MVVYSTPHQKCSNSSVHSEKPPTLNPESNSRAHRTETPSNSGTSGAPSQAPARLPSQTLSPKIQDWTPLPLLSSLQTTSFRARQCSEFPPYLQVARTRQSHHLRIVVMVSILEGDF